MVRLLPGSVGPPGLPSPNPLMPGQNFKLQKGSYTTLGLTTALSRSRALSQVVGVGKTNVDKALDTFPSIVR